MCGIAGIVDYDKPIDSGLLDDMLRRIGHRGPDDEGRFNASHFAIGMRRLSIIDVQGGRQPLSNEDQTVWVVFNGEIYNYLELRSSLEAKGHVFRTHSDTEVLVHLYEEYESDFPSQLNGMFGLALWDTRRKCVLLARDHLGIKPLYWHFACGRLIFGSELRCLLAGGVAPELDTHAIASYLHLGYIPRKGAPFRGVQKLEPGCQLLFKSGDAPRKMRYWTLSKAYGQGNSATAADIEEHAGALLRDAVRLQLRSDVPLGTFLSGGIDSSAITALAAKHLPHINSFSVGFEGHYFDETEYARTVSTHCRTTHHEQWVKPEQLLDHLDILAWHIDEPNSDPALLPTYLMCRYARQHVKVALSGNGGDEVFGGYPRHFDPPVRHSRADCVRSWLPSSARRALARMMGVRGDLRLHRLLADLDLIGMSYWVAHARPPVADDVTPWAVQSFSVLDWLEKIYDEVKRQDWVNRRLYYDSTTYMPDQILNMVDRASMAVSLEVRVPMLDVRLVECLAGLDGLQKIEPGVSGKKILKNILRGELPEAIFARRKLGFGMPLVNWIEHGPLRRAMDALPEGRVAQEGLLDSTALRRWLKLPGAVKVHWMYFWNLLMLELWLHQVQEPAPARRGV